MSWLQRKLMTRVASSAKIYATFNPLDKDQEIAITNNNLSATLINYTANVRAYLNTTKATGLWAVEFEQILINASSFAITFGAGTSYSFGSGSRFGEIPYESAKQQFISSARQTTYIASASSTTSFWDNTPATDTKVLIVFDPANRKIGAVKNGILVFGSQAGGVNPLSIFGVSMYVGSSANSSIILTLNSGQAPFTATNESLIAAYETANSVTINRGLWA